MGTSIGIERKFKNCKGSAYLYLGRYYRIAPDGWVIQLSEENLGDAIQEVEEDILELKGQILGWAGYRAPEPPQHTEVVNRMSEIMEDIQEASMKLANLILIRNSLDEGFKMLIS